MLKPSIRRFQLILCNLIFKQLDRINRNFIWGSTEEKRKTHAVKWSNVTKEKIFGGLGLRGSQYSNLIAMAKLNWRFLREENSLWARVLRGKYSSPLRHQYCPSSLWHGMCKGYPLMMTGSRKIIRNGRSTLFWSDNWLGPDPLRGMVVGPLNCNDLLLTVRDVWDHNQWDLNLISFRLPCQGHPTN